MDQPAQRHSGSDRIQTLTHKGNGCLSCGTTENMGRRRYCSVACRQRLRHALNVRTGLLKALNVRYATFYFTEMAIIMDVLPYGGLHIFSFIHKRVGEQTPADDFRRLADKLGNAWWAEKRRTNRRYLASDRVLEEAWSTHGDTASLRPIEIKIPTIKGGALMCLKIDKSTLETPDLQQTIKAAYRLQAKKSHPDHGGDAVLFRKVHHAYEELIRWSEKPRFHKRSGFPDKWFYEGLKNRWVQPTPCG